MKKAILFTGIVVVVSILISVNTKATSYIYFTGVDFEKANDTYTYTLDKDDFSPQYVQNESYDSLFKSEFEGKITGSMDVTNKCDTSYLKLANNQTIEFIGCALNPYYGNKTDLTIKITKKGLADSIFRGWWAAVESLAR